MKKVFLTLGALGTALAVMPMFAAFEAHVVNVTATIENALTVPLEQGGLTFGNIFPEEVVNKTVDIRLSDSFLAVANTEANEVDYIIRQKPKCGLPNPGTDPLTYSAYAQVTEDEGGNFVCPQGYQQLPLLCPFLSKHPDGNPANDGSLDAFHGPLADWSATTSAAFDVPGKLIKPIDNSDAWTIDLHAPCFKGSCAQDNVIKPEYQADPQFEHQQFGCDLWFEVTNITTTSTPL